MNALLEEKLSALEQTGVAPAILEHLRAHIEQAPDGGLQQIPPYRMADAWNLPRHDVLEAFLYGTRLGLFDLEWGIHCPYCTGVVVDTSQLAELRPQTHCEFCGIDIHASFDEAVEVTFKINDNIHPVKKVDWGELATYWKYLEPMGQLYIPANTTQEVSIEFQPGNYYIAMPAVRVDDIPATEPQVLEVVFNADDIYRTNKAVYHPGPCTLRLINQTTREINTHWLYRIPYPWTSAAEIASTQSFRDLFASELISADETFAIRSLVIVFTDIKGSTALYERLGDSQAYRLVKEHFHILTQKVKEHHGAVVKTIGDAVMATFTVSADAMAAMLDMQIAFDDFNQGKYPREDIIIKVGAHRGPCIAVTSNDRLDYFGRTVNIASRVQGLSEGHDIMLTRSFHDEPAVQDVLAASHWAARHFQARLRGLEDMYAVVHLTHP